MTRDMKRMVARNLCCSSLGLSRAIVDEISHTWTSTQIDEICRLSDENELQAVAVQMIPDARLPERYRGMSIPEIEIEETITLPTPTIPIEVSEGFDT